MCGIVGIVYRDGSMRAPEGLLARMQRCIHHRGPDDSGAHEDWGAGLGFQRLAIIDIAAGHQPMYNEDGSVVVVFNGEIYNHHELRAELESKGHNFATRSDTEVLVHGWEEWGSGLPARLRGMFAFAVVERGRPGVFLARDRTGKKPLFYALHGEGTQGECLLFASEIKSLLAFRDLDRSIDPVAIYHYLTYQYVPQPWSVFRAVRKLEPAHWVDWRGGEPQSQRYWELDYSRKISIPMEEAISRSGEMLDDAVRVRLESEVPLGCFLSGGIDSSLVTAAMRRQSSGTLRTFSIGFREAAFNELPHARLVAEQLETQHEEFIVEPDSMTCLGELAWHFDEPFADSSALPTWYLSKMTRAHVTVALNGDGGDESFAGYERYREASRRRWYREAPLELRLAVAKGLGAASRALPANWLGRLARGAEMASLPAESFYIRYMTYFRPWEKEDILTQDFLDQVPASNRDSEALMRMVMQDSARAGSGVDAMMAADIEYYLPGALLPKVDRTSMGNSLECRSPFLDHPLMEFAASLPTEQKFAGGRLKHILKELAAREFSPEFVNRPKAGFGVPLGDWFRGRLKPLAQELLLSERTRARGMIDTAAAEKLLDQHLAGTHEHQYRLWALVMLEAWARTYVDREDPTAGPVAGLSL